MSFLFFVFDFYNLSMKCTHLGLIWERAFKDPASDTIILLSPIHVSLFYHHQNAASCQSHVEQSFHAASPSAPTVRLAPLAAHLATSLLSVKCSTRVGRRPVTGGTLREILPMSWRITISHRVHVSQPAFRDTVTLTVHHFVMLVRGGGARWLSKCITVLHPPLSLVLITVAGGGVVQVGVWISGGIYTSFLFNFLCSDFKILLLIKCESCLFPIASLFNRLHTQYIYANNCMMDKWMGCLNGECCHHHHGCSDEDSHFSSIHHHCSLQQHRLRSEGHCRVQGGGELAAASLPPSRCLPHWCPEQVWPQWIQPT